MDRARMPGRAYLAASVFLLASTAAFAADEPRLDKPLLAHWTFNDKGDSIRDVSGDPALSLQASSGVSRRRGVYGKALDLEGRPGLVMGVGPWSGELPEIGFSVWVKPSTLTGHREIFRQDCRERVLFSFQRGGAVLSLGLNVNGYMELDAPVDTAEVLDGLWHHAAATYDGEFQRVYLDGREVGSIKRPGTIVTRSDAPCYVASSRGEHSFFEGALDDLRIYREALTAEEVADLYQRGLDALARHRKELQEKLASIYTPGSSFAETLAGTRKNICQKESGGLERELADAALAGLKASFPEDYRNFILWTGANPSEYLLTRDNSFNLRQAERFVGLLFEYRPLTEQQWKKQSPEELRQWEEAGAIERKFERLVSLGDAATFAPGWIELILEAGQRIQFRPYLEEAVAPYEKPHTPETRDLSAAEAREALERDWLHQADNDPGPRRIQDEIRWTRALARRIQSSSADGVDFAGELAALSRLESEASSLTGPDEAVYFRVREIKRAILFQNPVVDFDKVLFVDMPYPAGREWRHQTRHRLGYMAVPGGRLLVLDGLSPAGRLRQLMPQTPLHGSFWRPDLSYDAGKVLFCFKPHNEKSFHLWEINVDGTGLVQLTDGRFDDLDPIYLPDEENIVFSTTRGHTYVRCMPPTNAFVLARSKRDGQDIYLISYNNEPDYLPSVLNDGRLVYTRWEYTDKPLWRAQALWTVYPDGTSVETLWGNKSVWPDLLKDARSIPGSWRLMFTGSAHHDWFAGSVGIIDPSKGLNFPAGLTKVTADVAWPESGNGPVDPIESANYHPSGEYVAYFSPYPLGEQDFLVSANRGGKFVLYLMDLDGNRELIYEGVHNIFYALPLKPRPRPPVLPDRVAWPKKKDRLRPQSGVIFSNNVYQGAPEELRGKARFLRVLTIDDKTYTYWHKRPYLSTGPVVSAVQSEGVKRVLGTVPIEEDGSVAFHAPSGKPLHFQLLDANYRALQTMRSFTGLMPGESRGCQGCHERHSTAPQADAPSLALARGPRKITPPPWGDDTVGYSRYVRPVLDRYCGECHQGSGEAREEFDLTPRPGFLFFDESYLILTGRPSWGKPYEKPEKPEPGLGIANMIMVEGYDTRDPAGYKTPAPMTRLSYSSRLIELASSGEHYDVKVDPVNLRRLAVWIDTMCPYRGDEEVREIPDPDFQGVDWLAIRPLIKTAPRIVRPGPVD